MVDLSDVTTDEMFDELRKRNDGVIIAAWQFRADKRYAGYTNWQGSKVILAGLLKQLERELEFAWQCDEAKTVTEDDDE